MRKTEEMELEPAFFEQDNSPWGFKPYRYRCPICGGWRVIHISDIAKPFAAKGWVCHLTFKCVKCFSTVTHSIPIDDEYREELIKRRGGKTAYAPWTNYWNQKDEFPQFLEILTKKEKDKILKRLESLGYF